MVDALPCMVLGADVGRYSRTTRWSTVLPAESAANPGSDAAAWMTGTPPDVPAVPSTYDEEPEQA